MNQVRYRLGKMAYTVSLPVLHAFLKGQYEVAAVAGNSCWQWRRDDIAMGLALTEISMVILLRAYFKTISKMKQEYESVGVMGTVTQWDSGKNPWSGSVA